MKQIKITVVINCVAVKAWVTTSHQLHTAIRLVVDSRTRTLCGDTLMLRLDNRQVQAKTVIFSCQSFLSGFSYLKPYYLE